MSIISAPSDWNLWILFSIDVLTSSSRPGCSKHSLIIPIFKPLIDLLRLDMTELSTDIDLQAQIIYLIWLHKAEVKDLEMKFKEEF